VSSLKIRHTIFAILTTVFLNNAVKANEINTASGLKGIDNQKTSTKLLGLSRNEALALLGQPQRCEEIFPFSNHRTQIDDYRINAQSDKHLRITYDKSNNVSATEFEPTPFVIPKFMGEKIGEVSLTDTKLRNFFHIWSEEKVQNMSATKIKEKLGKPNQSWHETTKSGGRDRHFMHYLYYLSNDGRRAFVVMFDQDSNTVYEYRVQSISN
jgi:hypothetical protein